MDLLLAFAAPLIQCMAPQMPYPPSTAITGIEFDFASRDRRAPGSDNWPVTWGADGHQYTAWGDGGGFGGTNNEGRVSLGVARVEGETGDYRGINMWGGKNGLSPAQFEGKSYGILALGEMLYMWVSPGSGEENNREARLAWSHDGGTTWTRADWAFGGAEGIIVPTFCQFGAGYAGAHDEYVYVYAPRLHQSDARMQIPGQIDLLRAPADRIRERKAYTFFAGKDKAGQPQWTPDPENKVAVLEDPSGLHRTSVSYHPGLKRYLLCTEHTDAYVGNLAIFDAPDPWGPWTTVVYETNWGSFGKTFFWCLPTKWFQPDNRFIMVFTGTGDNDAWNTVEGRFLTKE